MRTSKNHFFFNLFFGEISLVKENIDLKEWILSVSLSSFSFATSNYERSN
jgi:hypothetical protein